MSQGAKTTKITRLATPRHLLQQALVGLERQVDDGIVQRVPRVDMPMGNVEAVDSTALNWLITTNSRLKNLNIDFQLVQPSSVMMDVLIATRLDTRFLISKEDTGEAGL